MSLRMLRGIAVAAFMASAAMPAQAQPELFDSATEITDQALTICAAVVLDGQTFDAQLEGRREWMSMEPRHSGSDLATHAWRAMTFNDTYIMRLPNGGCSFAIAEGDSAALRTQILGALAARAPFELVSEEETRRGRAVRASYCVREDYPRVMSIVAGQRRSKPVLVVNMFRASDRAPTFCAAT